MSVLYVVATPIGNLSDSTHRLAEILAEVDVIAAEDTRRTGQLLQHLGIESKLMPFHAHNEHQSVEAVMTQLNAGKRVALVSDAGTPLISDPGYGLVKRCHEEAISVVPVPGPSSITAALSVAGLPTHRFAFEGFIPAKSNARKLFFRALSQEPRTLVMFETPHRIEASVRALSEEMGFDREMTVCRELTKTFEQIVSGTAGNILERLLDGGIPAKGEYVLVVHGAKDQTMTDADTLLTVLLESMSPSKAATAGARLTGRPKSELYDRAVQLNKQLESSEDNR